MTTPLGMKCPCQIRQQHPSLCQHCLCGALPPKHLIRRSNSLTSSGAAQAVLLETRCIPGGMDSRRLESLLRQYDGVRVLHLGDAPRIWGGWHDASVSWGHHTCGYDRTRECPLLCVDGLLAIGPSLLAKFAGWRAFCCAAAAGSGCSQQFGHCITCNELPDASCSSPAGCSRGWMWRCGTGWAASPLQQNCWGATAQSPTPGAPSRMCPRCAAASVPDNMAPVSEAVRTPSVAVA